eukprot:scaffold279473_cov59-Attheya_sp.AAC.1
MQSLDDTKSNITIHIPCLTVDPVVVESNKLTSGIVPYKEVRVREANTMNYSPCLLWRTTTNFPTFDCFYFHTDGKVFPLQMTIAMIHDLKKVALLRPLEVNLVHCRHSRRVWVGPGG